MPSISRRVNCELSLIRVISSVQPDGKHNRKYSYRVKRRHRRRLFRHVCIWRDRGRRRPGRPHTLRRSRTWWSASALRWRRDAIRCANRPDNALGSRQQGITRRVRPDARHASRKSKSLGELTVWMPTPLPASGATPTSPNVCCVGGERCSLTGTQTPTKGTSAHGPMGATAAAGDAPRNATASPAAIAKRERQLLRGIVDPSVDLVSKLVLIERMPDNVRNDVDKQAKPDALNRRPGSAQVSCRLRDRARQRTHSAAIALAAAHGGRLVPRTMGIHFLAWRLPTGEHGMDWAEQ
jgi:hypothetical protein